MFDLAERLKIHRLMAIGLMECLWHVAAKNTPRGDIGSYSDAAIAQLVGWDGKPALLIEALVAARWLDRHETHRLVIHDWSEHCENSVHSLLKKRRESFIDGSSAFNRKSQIVHEPCMNETSTTREAKAKAMALGSFASEENYPDGNPSSRADAKTNGFDSPVSDWLDQRVSEHPNKKDWFIGQAALAKRFGACPDADRERFERNHKLWIESDKWRDKNGAFASKLWEFVESGEWEKPPPGMVLSGTATMKKKTKREDFY